MEIRATAALEPISTPGVSQPTIIETQDADVLHLLGEEFSVIKQTVPTGRVRVETRTREREVLIDEILTRHNIEVSTVPMGLWIDAFPNVRMEGDSTIVPVVEEVLVIERRLRLKEELRIEPRRTMERFREKITLRSQEAIITRDQV